uniref:Uncharacterized protein n=1 Tax=Palpitomonas bilix TaxID=652834 RepID=A0A7S3DJC1_9EUKA
MFDMIDFQERHFCNPNAIAQGITNLHEVQQCKVDLTEQKSAKIDGAMIREVERMKRDIPDHEEFAYEDEFAYEGEESSFIRKEHGDHEKDSVQEREARLRIGTDIANAWSEFAPRWKRTVQQLKIPFRLSRSLSIWRSFWLELKSKKGTKSNAMLFVKAAQRLLCVDA